MSRMCVELQAYLSVQFYLKESVFMKFKRTSYLTRLAALGVAAATLIVPFGTVNAADAKNPVNTGKGVYSKDTKVSSFEKQLTSNKKRQ